MDSLTFVHFSWEARGAKVGLGTYGSESIHVLIRLHSDAERVEILDVGGEDSLVVDV